VRHVHHSGRQPRVHMAPSRTWGASPVAAGGGDIAATYGQTEANKVLNDAVATIRSIAEERHPQAVDWAATTVANAKSYSAQEAWLPTCINGIAASLGDVLSQAEGQTVHDQQRAGRRPHEWRHDGHPRRGRQSSRSSTDWTTRTSRHPARSSASSACWSSSFHPTLLMGLIGAFSLALSFYGSGSLPLNVLGVVLVILGISMLVIEPNVPSHWIAHGRRPGQLRRRGRGLLRVARSLSSGVNSRVADHRHDDRRGGRLRPDPGAIAP